MQALKKALRGFTLFLIVLNISTGVFAEEDMEGISLGELLNLEIVTAGKKDEKVSDIPASVVIVTREDIERYGYTTLEEVLENVPGMYAIEDPAYKKSFGIRGYWTGYPRNIVFLVNGIRQTDGIFNYNLMPYFNLPVEAIDRIEVVRGPMSVIYGGGAFFGAINIITNRVSDGEPVNILSVSAGSQETVRTAIRVVDREGNLDYVLNAGYYDTYGQDEPYSKMASDTSSLSALGVSDENDSTDGRLENDARYFNFSGHFRGFYTDISHNRSLHESYLSVPSFSDGMPYLRKNTKLSAGYKNELSDKLSLDGKLTYHDFSFNLDWDWFSEDFYGNSNAKSETYEAELNAYYYPNAELDITLGLYFQRTTGARFNANLPALSAVYRIDTDDMDTWAVFGQANYNLSEKLRLVAGIRLDQLKKHSIKIWGNPGDPDASVLEEVYDQDDIEVIPRFAAIYSLNENNVFKFLYGKAIDRSSFFQNQDQVRSGLPDLESEEIQTFELNYITVPSPRLTVNASLFHNILDNLIVRKAFIDDDDVWRSYSANSGKMVTDGAELTLQTTPFSRFLAELSLTWQKTEDKREGLEDTDVEYSPELLGYLKASYRFERDITFALTGRYVGEMETHWDVAMLNPDGTVGGRIGKKTDSYFTLDANLRFENLFGKGLYMNIRGTNLFDKDYLYPTYVNSRWADKGIPGTGRTFMATLGWKF